ncbi:NAD-dependent epimerase/dehydratase family protein [Allostreptomyces psammosilenae]|uniref:Nucleoside-diphosphate-sugar epimerase n=1 Tax=Allostreptomyces psammosilenae TaxID=1892865 RepID=A0A853A2Y1_9ACTN|nr:NAD(P)-dependent oxidoreductase [Allostreptomyces psammosilenae]NYI07830.1 nucleoside-diphosphate-sugar epimerase [Allostreptomyces psammosilenae]
MRVLVTGATGEVGRRVVPRLLGRGGAGAELRVRVLVRDAARAEPLVRAGAEPMEGDLRDEAVRRRAVAGMDAVLHVAAAFRGVPDEEAYAVNRDATIALAGAALAEGVGRFVFVSTNLVYGAGRGRPAEEDDPTLTAAGEGLSGAYPHSKAEAERALLALHRERGLGLRIARLAFVYGDGDPHLRQALQWPGEWNGHHRFQMVHHADVAQGLLRVLLAPGVDGRIYNIADDAPFSVVDVHRINGVPVPEGLAERPDVDPWHGIVSTLRVRDELGFRPLYPSLWTARDAGAL